MKFICIWVWNSFFDISLGRGKYGMSWMFSSIDKIYLRTVLCVFLIPVLMACTYVVLASFVDSLAFFCFSLIVYHILRHFDYLGPVWDFVEINDEWFWIRRAYKMISQISNFSLFSNYLRNFTLRLPVVLGAFLSRSHDIPGPQRIKRGQGSQRSKIILNKMFRFVIWGLTGKMKHSFEACSHMNVSL